MKMLPLLIGWAILATVVIALAFYRRAVARKEDDFLHVDVQTNAQQVEIAQKLEGIDKWGKLLTIVAVVYAVALLGVYLYNGWNESAHIQ